DDGASWALDTAGMGAKFVTSFTVIGADSSSPTIFAGVFPGGVFRSTDRGARWVAASDGLTNTAVIALAVIGNTLFAGIHGAGVYRSTDNGSSWAPDTNGLSNPNIFSLLAIGTKASPTVLIAGTDGRGSIYLSTDTGASWTGGQNGLPFLVSIEALAMSGINSPSPMLFAGTFGAGVYLSTDMGKSWTAAGLSYGPNGILSLAVSGSNLFAGTDGRGVWRRALSDFGISSVAQTAPSTPLEIQAYPNPFSQSTTIAFTSESQGYADVRIVNLLGVEVARLYFGELSAGEHSFQWDANGFVPGMYECVVQMNGRVARTAIVLAR
ncbi:MAG TPA: T9SS type A sorting domain-containing protein, partial [Candidatus Kapabacteria bacterium]|nr:T9SS type A sorting domain-containing protein [Candidatus Kapabacteria bacterium]